MTGLLALLRPRTLAGQILLVVASSLFIVQLFGFGFYYLAQRGQWLNIAAAPGVIRILDALDLTDRAPRLPLAEGFGPGRGHGGGMPGFGREPGGVITSTSAPAPIGEDRPAIAARAHDMLANAGLTPLAVHASVAEGMGRRHMAAIWGNGPMNGMGRLRVQIAVQVGPRHWVTAYGRSAPVPRPDVPRLIGITLLIYALVLLPLIWFTRRLAAPLAVLTEATARVGKPGATEPIAETGPDDLRGLAAAFNRMEQRIGAMLAEKDHMLGAIGHDLRTPLTALRVRVETAAEGAERDKMVATIDDMRQMLDDILSLARIGRDREPPQKVDLASLAEAAVEDFIDAGAPVAALDMPRAIVNVHPRAIRRALANLVDNAVKYGEAAEVSLRKEGGRAILAVTDKGPGIAPDRIEDMLQPFTRMEGSRSRETGGAGLGLAIVRAVASAEGGTLRLVNQPEGGLRAEISLPLAD